ncbi:hypothetical protein F5Y07DRAFT_257090 [Xylaria sp. FL0933]|nr:hypothetical protein F5Y07DRAFT_257090 [Xylaria sp. FL0933]
MPVELPVLTIADAATWANWLVRNASTSKGVWLTLAKKGNTTPTSLTYAQALDEALCQGWIDGQARGGDDRTYSQRFTPRTAKSLWSRRNIANVARLEQEGRVTALGRAAIDAAKADGRWDAAYAGQASAEVPPEFLAAVAAVPAAQEMWDGLNKSNRFAVYFRLNALKTEAGRERRIRAFVEMLARGESLVPQKQKQKQKQRSGVKGAGREASAAVSEKRTERAERVDVKAVEEKAVVMTTTRIRRTATSQGDGEPVRRSRRLLKATAPSP